MTTLQKLVIENSNNAKNLEKIAELVNEVIEYIKEDNDGLEDAEVDLQTGKMQYDFTQECLDESDSLSDLYYIVGEAFHYEFNNRVKMEIPELF